MGFPFLFVCANNIKPFIRFLIERTYCWCWCWLVAMLLYCMLYFCVLFRLIYGILFISNFPYLMLLFRCFMPLSHRALVTNRNSYISENFFENAILTLKTNGLEIFFWREAKDGIAKITKTDTRDLFTNSKNCPKIGNWGYSNAITPI